MAPKQKCKPQVAHREATLMLRHLKDSAASNEAKLAAARYFRKMLSRSGEVPSTEVITALLRLDGLVPALCDCLFEWHLPELQLDSAWAITNLVCGNRVQTHKVVQTGVLGSLVRVQQMSGNASELCMQTVWAVGNIAGDCAQCKLAVIEAGFVPKLLMMIHDATQACITRIDNERAIKAETAARLQTCVWTLANMCRGRVLNDELGFEQLTQVLPSLASLITRKEHLDDELLADVLWTLTFMSNAANHAQIQQMMDVLVCVFVVQCVHHQVVRVSNGALRLLGNLLAGNDLQTEHLLQCDMLLALKHAIRSDQVDIRKSAYWALSNVAAGTNAQIKQLTDNKTIMHETFSALYQDDDTVAKECAWLICNVCQSTPAPQERYCRLLLVEYNALHALLHILAHQPWRDNEPQLLSCVIQSVHVLLKLLHTPAQAKCILQPLFDQSAKLPHNVRQQYIELYNKYIIINNNNNNTNNITSQPLKTPQSDYIRFTRPVEFQ